MRMRVLLRGRDLAGIQKRECARARARCTCATACACGRLRRRAGCVPVRAAPGGSLDVLLVRSRKHPAHFIFPAGGVERGEGMADAAARETHEEARRARCARC
eukprot:6172046-Pleurochrysis_carterae.AAC.6